MVKAALLAALCIQAITIANGTLSRRIAATQRNSTNLCFDGRMAPELILVGAARSSSTTLARDFQQVESVIFPHCIPEDGVGWGSCPRTRKEIHFFNMPERVHKGRSFWLKHYPECKQDQRLLGIDLTPNYHYADGAADGIVQLYGSGLSRVKFLTLVREPLSQIQSFFYYNNIPAESFSGWLEEHLEKYQEDPEKNQKHIANSMYAPVLKKFMAKVPARQFIIVPMQYNAGPKDGMPVLWQGLLKMFGLKVPTKHAAVKPNHAEHPRLEDEMDAATLSARRATIYALTGPQQIAEVLASPSSNDAPMLYGYKKGPQDVAAIAQWIEAGWL